MMYFYLKNKGVGICVRVTVVARWAAGQQVERSHNKIQLISPDCPRPSIVLTMQNLNKNTIYVISDVKQAYKVL